MYGWARSPEWLMGSTVRALGEHLRFIAQGWESINAKERTLRFGNGLQ